MIDNNSLQFAVSHDIIPEDEIRLRIEMYEKEYYLAMHSNKIWQDKDGFYYTYVEGIRPSAKRKRIKRKHLSDLENTIALFYKEHADEPNIQEVFEEWIEQKVKYGEIKRQSYDRYTVDFKRFFSNSPLNDMLFRHITEEMLEDFIKSAIHDYNLSARSWGNLRILLNGIFKYGKKKGYTGLSISNFMGDLELSKKAFRRVIHDPEKSVFRPDEIKLIKAYIERSPQSIINLGILLVFETGLRIGELSVLKTRDLHLEKHTATIARTEVRYKNADGHYIFDIEEATKGRDGIRTIILTDGAIEILKKIRRINPFGEFLFMDSRTGQRIKGRAFTEKLRKICRHVGITERSMHKIRKTYGTNLLNSKVIDDALVQNQMGHADIETTRKYYYFDMSTNEEALAQIRRADQVIKKRASEA